LHFIVGKSAKQFETELNSGEQCQTMPSGNLVIVVSFSKTFNILRIRALFSQVITLKYCRIFITPIMSYGNGTLITRAKRILKTISSEAFAKLFR